MTQLPIGPPTRPPTRLDEDGLTKIVNRLSLVLDTRGFGDDMVPAIKNAMETLITQDMPALLAYVVSHKAPDAEIDVETRLWPMMGGRPL